MERINLSEDVEVVNDTDGSDNKEVVDEIMIQM